MVRLIDQENLLSEHFTNDELSTQHLDFWAADFDYDQLEAEGEDSNPPNKASYATPLALLI